MDLGRASSPPHVVLIGRRLPHNDNLGLAYLQAALLREGCSCRVVALNEWGDMDRAAAITERERPALVGLALPDGGSALLPLGLGELLRRTGYRGHITAGGPFATLARQWLLSRYDWLDSVVRFAGEVPLPQLAHAIADGGTPVEKLGGISTRAGDGPPAPVLATAPLALVPERGELPELLGHRMAHLAATRGCRGRCAYCGPAALQRLERNEGRQQGCSASDLSAAGVGGVRRRPLAEICDEMATLWHERDVRYFYFVDEHLLPYAEDEALLFLSRWRELLRQRGIEQPNLGCMLRADHLTDRVATAFADLGLIRCFVGLELLTQAEQRQYGRGGDVDHALAIMRSLEARGVATICNAMLVHPYSTATSLEQGVARLRAMPDTPFEATRMQIYHGTSLCERLTTAGRIRGNPLRYDYVFDQPVVARFADLYGRLRGEAVGNYSLSYHLQDVRLVLALAGRLRPALSLEPLRRRAARAARAANELRAASLQGALVLAHGTPSAGYEAATTQLVWRTGLVAQRLDAEVEQLWQALRAKLDWQGNLFSPMQSAAATVVSFVMAGSAATGCAPSPPSPAGAPAVTVVASAAAPVGTEAPDAGVPDASATPEPSGPVDAGPLHPSVRCTDYTQTHKYRSRAKRAARRAAPCRSGSIRIDSDGASVSIHAAKWTIEEHQRIAVEAKLCSPIPHPELLAMAQAVEAELSPDELACLAGADIELSEKDAKQARRLLERAEKACGGIAGLQVELDANGEVSGVQIDEPDSASAAAVRCVENALRGLKFPCLAGHQLCRSVIRREWIIYE